MSRGWNQTLDIGGRRIGGEALVFIIAEAGVAHFGDIQKAFQLVDLAVEAKADAVKFQIFRTDALISSEAPDWKARMAGKELDFKAFREIRDYCDDKGILFLATAHDGPSLDCLNELDVPAYKVGSGELKNWEFISRIARQGKSVLLSTGMYTLSDIRQAVDCIAETGNRDLALLHCVTAYPTPPGQVNLNAVQTIAREFGIITGYSDHTRGIHFPLAAVAVGARIIEKHITLNYNIPNAQDWKVSCGPDNLHTLVDQIREIEKGLGTGVKKPGEVEAQSILWARKSLMAARDIEPGETLTRELIIAKRPGTGIDPSDYGNILGHRAKKRITRDALILWESIE